LRLLVLETVSMPDERPSESKPATHPLIERAQRARMGRAARWRTAEHHASYFLPYLTAGMDLLDVGCGPGSITRGLARHVAPGRAVGLDSQRGNLPESLATEDEGSPRFVVADALHLPFADASFDAAHAHALFQHLSDPLGAMAELHRVLRPGGVVGVADWDRELVILHPAPALLVRALSWLSVLREQDGGDPRAGRFLAETMARAGFVQPAMTVVADGLATSRTGRETGEHWAVTFEQESTRERLGEAGLATAAELAAVPAAWRAWGHEPGAILIVHWFCAVAWKARA
jgi:ubiquinone/menaquinone biosynthesis C-methylase UbiE